MVTHNVPIEDRVTEALRRLEEGLGTPIVPGALDAWANTVNEEMCVVDALLHEHYKSSHERDFTTISKNDPEQLSRVQQLREVDVKLRTGFDELTLQAVESWSRIQASDGTSSDSDLLLQTFVTNALQWIRSVRMHEQAIDTWFHESFNRDRGVGD